MKFYILLPEEKIRFGTKWAYGRQGEPSLTSNEPLDQCPQCGETIGPLQWLPPHKLRLSSSNPKKWPDIVWGTWLSGLMLYKRFKELFEKEQLKGVEILYPQAQIMQFGSKKASQVPRPHPIYYLAKFKWNGANLDDEASQVVRYEARSKCIYCRGIGAGAKRYDRVIFEKDSWTGMDIFIARGLEGVIVISQKFKDVAEKHSITNTLFIPAEKYAYNERRAGTGSPTGLWYIRE